MATMRNARPKLRTIEVNLGDDSTLRWVSLLPEGVIHANGMAWNLAADVTDPDSLRFRFDDVVASLHAWLAEYAPPVAVEHTKDGTAAGYLRRIVVLTKEEAAELGIRQPVDRMIYGGLDLTSERWAAAFDAGEIPYISPNIRAYASTETEAEPRFIFGIGEVSFVTVPQIKTNQIPVAEMRGVSLAESPMKMSMEECAAYCAENGMDEAAIAALIKAMFPELHKEAHEANPELAEDAEAIEAAAVAELERAAAIEAEKEEEEEAEKPEAMLSEITRLKAALLKERRANALSAVTSDLKGRKVSDATKAKLAESFLSDKVAYRALISDLGVAPSASKMSAPVATARTTAPIAPGAGGLSASLSEVLANPRRFADLTEDAQWGMISDLAEREKCEHWLAASWLMTGKMPQTVTELRNSRGFGGR
jgi:hypothetical protein